MGAGCRNVEFAYAPNRAARVSYVLAALAVLLLLGIALAGAARQRVRPAEGTWATGPVVPLGLTGRSALLFGVAAFPVASLMFSLRAGVAVAVGVALLLWRGISVRGLAATAAALIGVVVPALYVVFMPPHSGGFNSRYAVSLLSAHWVTVAVWVLLALACWSALRTARARRGDQAPGPGAEPAPRSLP